MLTKLEDTIKDVRKNMDKYDFHNVGNTLYSFIWDNFCDWYIELSKADMSNTNKSVLLKVLTSILKMLHPFMPFVTEEIYSMLPIKECETIMLSTYPKFEKKYVFKDDEIVLDKILEDIISIRNMKATNKITKDAKVSIKTKYEKIYKSQLKIKDINITEDKLNMLSSSYKSKYINIIYYYEGNKEDESKKLEEIKKLEESINRREKLLSNENYVNKAPKNIVDADRKKLEEEKEKLELLKRI